ncbi:hypothetical protein OV203_47845 [Nannocystis sp. ILAH1]|uniref:hypothetical protein n=1 Tax=unclassified Nannocystis TaxID=2627009 RepID=UPI00226D6245|nr:MULTISPECIES: hypothetical protein [unclassified Nannocystis]MCY0994934.1 hypothetical protein [Nannocystis sp. ILAH1]MCY1065237.1 hypothetical protein [Nannocystis sp. RBIL2]
MQPDIGELWRAYRGDPLRLDLLRRAEAEVVAGMAAAGDEEPVGQLLRRLREVLVLGHLRRALREQPRGSHDAGPGDAAGAFAGVLRAWAERLPESERQGLLQRAPSFADLQAARSGTSEQEPRKDEPADGERSLYEAFQLRDRDARWTALKRLAGPDDERLRYLYRRVQGTEFELPNEILSFPASALDRELWSERIRAEEVHSGHLPGELLLRYAKLLGEHERSAVVDRGLDAIEAAHPPLPLETFYGHASVLEPGQVRRAVAWILRQDDPREERLELVGELAGRLLELGHCGEAVAMIHGIDDGPAGARELGRMFALSAARGESAIGPVDAALTTDPKRLVYVQAFARELGGSEVIVRPDVAGELLARIGTLSDEDCRAAAVAAVIGALPRGVSLMPWLAAIDTSTRGAARRRSLLVLLESANLDGPQAATRLREVVAELLVDSSLAAEELAAACLASRCLPADERAPLWARWLTRHLDESQDVLASLSSPLGAVFVATLVELGGESALVQGCDVLVDVATTLA